MEKFVTLKKTKRKRKHGFMSKMANRSGQNIIKNRRLKKRSRLTI